MHCHSHGSINGALGAVAVFNYPIIGEAVAARMPVSACGRSALDRRNYSEIFAIEPSTACTAQDRPRDSVVLVAVLDFGRRQTGSLLGAEVLVPLGKTMQNE